MSFLRRKRRGKPSAAPAAEAAPPSPPPASPTRDGYGFVVKPAFADAYRAHVPMFVREEDSAFWLLSHVVEEVLIDHYVQSMLGHQVDSQVLEQLLEQQLPHIAAHLRSLSLSVPFVTTQWFLCLFLNVVYNFVMLDAIMLGRFPNFPIPFHLVALLFGWGRALLQHMVAKARSAVVVVFAGQPVPARRAKRSSAILSSNSV